MAETPEERRKFLKSQGFICDCGGEFKYSHDEWEVSVYKCDKCGATKPFIHGRGWTEDLFEKKKD